jgi:hypothetical protein
MEKKFYQPENYTTGFMNGFEQKTKMASPPPYPGSPQQYYDLDEATECNNLYTENMLVDDQSNADDYTMLSLFEVKSEPKQTTSNVIPRNKSGKIRKVPVAAPAASRPGRKAKTPDEALNHIELERRNRRRARNREAAQRQRERRMEKVESLENEVANLTNENDELISQNEKLRQQAKNLRFKLDMKMKQTYKTKPKALPIRLEPVTPVCNIPDELFTPGGSFVLSTPRTDKLIQFSFPDNFNEKTMIEEVQSSSTENLFKSVL